MELRGTLTPKLVTGVCFFVSARGCVVKRICKGCRASKASGSLQWHPFSLRPGGLPQRRPTPCTPKNNQRPTPSTPTKRPKQGVGSNGFSPHLEPMGFPIRGQRHGLLRRRRRLDPGVPIHAPRTKPAHLQKPGGVLRCCWVGSLDCNFLGNQGVSTKPPESETFCRGVNSNQVSGASKAMLCLRVG